MADNSLRCPVCNSRSLLEFLVRHDVPVHQNLLMRDQAAAIGIARGDLALVVCESCGFIFNHAFDPNKIMYGADYENNQACSPTFNEYIEELVRHLVVERKVRNCHVVEVGCGNGLFLRKLVEYEGASNRGYGFDPSYRGPSVDLDARLRFAQRYYDSACADLPTDVIVCRHVIEHVPRPLELLEDIRKALTNAVEPRLFFETPCAEWILRNRVVWDFFYEHCSYFSEASLTTAFQRAGFTVQGVRHVFAGQYLWLEATLSHEEPTIRKAPGTIVAQAREFAHCESRLKNEWAKKIRALSLKEKVALWGAGAKGVTFANLIDEDRKSLDCVVDLNPSKQGYFVPGTGHPIVSHKELVKRGVTAAILMNPNYRDENLALLGAAQVNVRLIETL